MTGQRTVYTAASTGGFLVVLDARLLEILRCPSCREPVKELATGDALECVACHRVYPIVDGIPVMLVGESKLPAR